MKLKQLQLRNYRNYDQLDLETDGQVNIFIGPNAQGKTNLLESIYVLALTKSHRTHKDREMIQWDRQEARLKGLVDKRYGPCRLELALLAGSKKASINGLEQSKLREFIGMLNVVLFAPEDLEMVKGSPGIRRRFMDMEIGQVRPGYLYNLLRYQRILVQRNQLLKQSDMDPAVKRSMLEVWDRQLAEQGSKIMEKRQSFIKKLQNWAESVHSGITGGRETVEIVYQPSFELDDGKVESVLFDQFMIKLSQVKDQEIRRGISLIGPHRDDLIFKINGMDVQQFGSQGQQRTTALSLKLAEIELIREEVGEYPVLLLDDVLSELDRDRQTRLIETFQGKVQTFITATGIESVNVHKLQDMRLFHVSGGEVRPEPS